MTTKLRFAGLAAILAVSFGLVACGEHAVEADVPDGKLLVTGAGATFPEPLYQKWIEAYAETAPGAVFTYEGIGSGGGIKRFIAREVDFGASDAAMNDEEIAQVEGGVQLIPMAAGMVVLAYNIPGVEKGLKLSRDVYSDIFLGKIRTWDDPRIVKENPGIELPAKTIAVVVRRDGSGTTFAMTSHLASVSEEWKTGPGVGKLIDWPGNAMTANGNEGVARLVKISEGSIAYMGYEFASRLDLPMAALQNKDGGFVMPSAESGQAALARFADDMPENLRAFMPDPPGADSYPIVSYTWLLLYAEYAEYAKAAALKSAIRWGLSNGQRLAAELGYIPLPENVIAKADAALDRIR